MSLASQIRAQAEEYLKGWNLLTQAMLRVTTSQGTLFKENYPRLK